MKENGRKAELAKRYASTFGKNQRRFVARFPLVSFIRFEQYYETSNDKLSIRVYK